MHTGAGSRSCSLRRTKPAAKPSANHKLTSVARRDAHHPWPPADAVRNALRDADAAALPDGLPAGPADEQAAAFLHEIPAARPEEHAALHAPADAVRLPARHAVAERSARAWLALAVALAAHAWLALAVALAARAWLALAVAPAARAWLALDVALAARSEPHAGPEPLARDFLPPAVALHFQRLKAHAAARVRRDAQPALAALLRAEHSLRGSWPARPALRQDVPAPGSPDDNLAARAPQTHPGSTDA